MMSFAVTLKEKKNAKKKKGGKNLTLKLEKSKSLKLTETPRRQKV